MEKGGNPMTAQASEAPETTPEEDWRIYRGSGQRYDDIGRLPPAPAWRRFRARQSDETPLVAQGLPEQDPGAQRAIGYQVADEAIEMVNAALYLRRPLLV